MEASLRAGADALILRAGEDLDEGPRELRSGVGRCSIRLGHRIVGQHRAGRILGQRQVAQVVGAIFARRANSLSVEVEREITRRADR